MVDLSAYQEQDFAGLFGSQAEGNDLLKAMQAGAITGRDTTNQLLTQEPLKIESLDKTLKLLEFRMKDVKLWNAIPKLTAYNTVEEYIQLESYGTDRGGFYGEGELSDVEDSKYRRRAELVKYIQVTGEVTLQAQMVRSYVAAMAKEVENKSMWIIRKVSSALTKADATYISKEFNGIYAQHASIGSAEGDLYTSLDAYQDSAAVIDLRGASIKQKDLAKAATNVDSNFGNVDSLFAPPTVLDGLANDYYERQRIMLNGSYQGVIGTVPKGIDTQFGTVNLFQDKFMKKTPARKIGDAATSPKAPLTPTATSQALVADAALSRFKAGGVHTDALGTVFYAVAAINEYGESPLRVLDNTTKITLTAAQSVDLVFTATAGAYSASGYVIYRSKITTATNATTGLVDFYPLFKVSTAELAAGFDGGAAGAVRDRNRFLPDTEEAFTTEMVDEVVAFKQLAPISKLDLAVVAPANRFLTFLWGTPQLYTPKKMVRFINVGPYIPPA
jgi:hypothetical protein